MSAGRESSLGSGMGAIRLENREDAKHNRGKEKKMDRKDGGRKRQRGQNRDEEREG